jgi:glucose/arabinose dehydrogenase
MKQLAIAVFVAVVSTVGYAQFNAGSQAPAADLPFVMTQIATFNLPWRLAFLPDGRMLITEKPGAVWLVTPEGGKTPVANVPAVLHQGQGARQADGERQHGQPRRAAGDLARHAEG